MGLYWKSRASLFGVPLVCIAFGPDENGRTRVAKGFIAVGQFAVGLITLAQFGVGILFGVGQFVIGVAVLGQFCAGLIAAFGQFAAGAFAIGQFVAGVYAIGQFGYAKYLWSPGRIDMEAVAMFHTVKMTFLGKGITLSQITGGLSRAFWEWYYSGVK
jgi:hypothetical protein